MIVAAYRAPDRTLRQPGAAASHPADRDGRLAEDPAALARHGARPAGAAASIERLALAVAARCIFCAASTGRAALTSLTTLWPPISLRWAATRGRCVRASIRRSGPRAALRRGAGGGASSRRPARGGVQATLDAAMKPLRRRSAPGRSNACNARASEAMAPPRRKPGADQPVGIDSHGIARLTHYQPLLAHGSINPAPQIVVTRSGPATAWWRAIVTLGIVVAHPRQPHRRWRSRARAGTWARWA